MRNDERQLRAVAIATALDDDRVALRSPGVGLWRDAPAAGSPIDGGGAIGVLETLGVRRPIDAPQDVHGHVTEVRSGESSRHPVGFGEVLLVLSLEADPRTKGATSGSPRAETQDARLAFCSPMSGRFHARPSPDKSPFVEAGQEISEGDTICLLEVMKTFNRVVYGGDGLPGRARIAAIVPADGDDLTRGDPILFLDVAE